MILINLIPSSFSALWAARFCWHQDNERAIISSCFSVVLLILALSISQYRVLLWIPIAPVLLYEVITWFTTRKCTSLMKKIERSEGPSKSQEPK